ncbi:MAG: formyltetrahydrofolate deformylase [Gammaproteobacteria bacterium]|nr:formyltetrahydrofolate deformylase [Gammaproteobacteria bacterium]MBU1624633.1 formyltetrahydrofolate deformylase [Gammaproteobacteria bacterium]MBU1982477.1 formyltetrahydrofolate deformylase [Gammaproteobacteria bacterium]
MSNTHRYTLTISCPDRSGIIAAVTGFIAEHGGFITEASYHTEQEAERFFMRQEMRADSLPFDAATFCEKFKPLADEFQMTWQLTDSANKKRLVVLVSKQDHCLDDLLHRWRSGELQVDIPCVISNHEDLRSFVEWHGIPFIHVDMASNDPTAKEAAFQHIAALFDEHQGDAMVLARFMQILPPWLCQRYPGRVINIHHSFLPSFVGAKPYHQAYQRGVKLIGATCHYVTDELDAGPIIEQDTVRIDHGDTPDDLVRYGRDIEKTVLARGLRYHVEDRVLVCGNKTIVFR